MKVFIRISPNITASHTTLSTRVMLCKLLVWANLNLREKQISTWHWSDKEWLSLQRGGAWPL